VGLLVCDIPLKPVTRDIFDRDHLRIARTPWTLGGDAANTAAALVRLGFDASLSALTGKDLYGDFLIDSLKNAGIDVRGVHKSDEHGTGVTFILIEPSGERHFIVTGSAHREMESKYTHRDLIEEADLVYIGSSMSMAEMDQIGSAELFKTAHSLGKLTATDFNGTDQERGDYWLKLLGPMLKETDIALPSLREAIELTGKKDLREIRDALAPFGMKILAVKLGDRGSYITDFKNEWNLPAFTDFETVDTTGAGDSYGAGFVRGFLSGWDPEACGIFASAVAGFNVTKVGAVAGVPDFETAYRFVTDRFGTARFPV